jgi:uncharacterized protein
LELPDHLVTQYPDEMTIVLEHQFWDLEVQEDRFLVTLNFRSKSERLVIPFEAITAFADPSVKFGLQFQGAADEVKLEPAASLAAVEAKPAKSAAEGQVVALDAFRKK